MRRWSEQEDQDLILKANQAKLKNITPYEFCQNRPLQNRDEIAIFWRLYKQDALIEKFNNVTSYTCFKKMWDDGLCKSAKWKVKEVMVNEEQEKTTISSGNTNLIVEQFKYKKEEEEKLIDYFEKLFSDDSESRCLVETGPTGLGKTHYMIEAIFKAIIDYFDSSIVQEPRTILLIAPQHRHLEHVKEKIELRVKKQFSDKLANGAINIVKVTSVNEMAQELKESDKFISQQCLYYNDSEKDDDDLKEQIKNGNSIIKIIEKIAEKILEISDLNTNLISTKRNELRKICAKIIETQNNPESCQQCQFMHVGKTIFYNEKDTDLQNRHGVINIVFSTYDKLFFGYDSYIVKKGKYTKLRYSPWVTQKSGIDTPIKNTYILMEESANGFHSLWKRIEEEKLQINLTEYVDYIYRYFRPALNKILAHIDDKDFIEKCQEKIQAVIDSIEKLYISANDTDVFIFKDRLSISFIGDSDSVDKIDHILQSTDNFFSSLFPKDIIAYQATQYEQLKTVIANVKKFKAYSDFKETEYNQVFPLTRYYKMYGIEKLVKFFRWFRYEVNNLPKDDYFELAVNNLFVDGNETSRDKRAYFNQQFNQISSGKKHLKKDKQDEILDVLDRFYLQGYEYMLMPYSHEKGEYYLAVHSCQRTPERMLSTLLCEDLHNKLLLVSASASIDSPIQTHNLKWIDETITNVTFRNKNSLDKIIKHKYNEKRMIPHIQIVEANEYSKIPNIETVLQKYIKLNKIKIDIFKNDLNRGTNDKSNILSNVFYLLKDIEKSSKPHYILLLANSGKEVTTCIKLIKNFFDWAKDENLAIESVKYEIFSAKDFKKILSEEENELEEETQTSKIDEFKGELIAHLLSNEKPKIFIIGSAYNSVAVGTNLQLQITLDQFQQAKSTVNLEKYIGNSNVLRYFKYSTIDIDISDILLTTPKTYIIDETNYISNSHILVANGEPDFTFLSKNLLDSTGKTSWWNISAALKKTSYYHLAQFDMAMQAIGRMDRSFNLPIDACIYINEEIAYSLRKLPKEKIEKVILTPTFKTVLEKCQEDIKISGFFKRDDISQYMSKLVKEGGFQVNPQQELIQNLWHEMRELFSNYQAIPSNKINFLDEQYNYIIKLFSQLKAPFSKKFEELFYKVPTQYFEIIEKPYSNENKYQSWILITYITKKNENYSYSNKSIDGENCHRQIFFCKYSPKDSEEIFILKPDMIRDIAIPAYDEKKLESNLNNHGYKTELLNQNTFEIADIYVKDQYVLIDNKSYSVDRMQKIKKDELKEFVKKAQEKLNKFKELAQTDKKHRFIYVMRHWWKAETKKWLYFDFNGREVNNNDRWNQLNDFEVAFVHVATANTEQQPDFFALEDTLDIIKLLNREN